MLREGEISVVNAAGLDKKNPQRYVAIPFPALMPVPSHFTIFEDQWLNIISRRNYLGYISTVQHIFGWPNFMQSHLPLW